MPPAERGFVNPRYEFAARANRVPPARLQRVVTAAAHRSFFRRNVRGRAGVGSESPALDDLRTIMSLADAIEGVQT
jgi:hypothetical protein